MTHTHRTIDPDPIAQAVLSDPHRPISWSWSRDPDWTTAKVYLQQRIFGTLVQLTQPIIERYHSDLFWDADMVTRLTGPTEWYYTVRDNGTHWSPNRDHLESVRRNWPHALSWHIKLTTDDGYWYLEASPYHWTPAHS